MLKIHNLDYESAATIVFQRLSVIVSDVVYFLGVLRFVAICAVCLVLTLCSVCYVLYPSQKGDERASRKNEWKRVIITGLALFNPGLIMVDNIHFQYNGFLTGILFLSIGCILRVCYSIAQHEYTQPPLHHHNSNK